jgi:hypothetical protein
MKFSKAQHEAIHRMFDLLVSTDRASRRSRKAMLVSIKKMKPRLKAELRIKVIELETAIFTDDQAKITREIKKLENDIHQTEEMLRFIAKHAADKEIAGAVTATLL